MENPYSPTATKPLHETPMPWRRWHTAVNLSLILISVFFCLPQLAKIFTDFGAMQDGRVSPTLYLFRITFLVLGSTCAVLLSKHNRNAQWAFVALAITMVASAYVVHYAGAIAILYAILGIAFSRYAARTGLFAGKA